MDIVKKWHGEKIAEKLKKNLEKRNIEMFYLEKKEDLTELIKSFVKENDTVSYGGSVTLKETGVFTVVVGLPLQAENPFCRLIF